MKILSIIIAKILIFTLKIMHRGSVFPGRVASKIDKNILEKLKLPKTIIAVTGSSGKGSTSSIIAKVYKSLGYSVVYNDKGSNLTDGILTTLLENCTLTGVIKKDVLIMEVDERYTKFVFPKVKPGYVVITNITRDQPPRQGHFDLVFEEIKKALTHSMHLILNGDDPYLQKFNLDNKYKVTYYTLDKYKYSYENQKFANLNIQYCLKCHSKLIYDYYHFETLGSYHCSKCDFKNPKSDYHITKLDKKWLVINNSKIELPSELLYNVYNTVAAFTTLSVLNLEQQKISEIISKINSDENIYSDYENNNKHFYVLNNKNENSTTFNQSLLFLDKFKSEKTIVIGWKEISRRYKYNDLSWLYDIDFELLNSHKIDKVICVGINKYDIATRIKYAGIDENKIVTCDNVEDTKDHFTKNDVFAILNFDYVKPFNNIVKDVTK